MRAFTADDCTTDSGCWPTPDESVSRRSSSRVSSVRSNSARRTRGLTLSFVSPEIQRITSSVNYGSLTYTYTMPSTLQTLASTRESNFLSSLPPVEDESAPSSIVELAALFLYHVTAAIAPGDPDPLSSLQFLSLLLQDFEDNLLEGGDVHTVAAALPGNEGAKLAVINGYFAAYGMVNSCSDAQKSALQKAEEAGKVVMYGICGGQGNQQGDEVLQELRQVYATYPAFVTGTLMSVSKLVKRLSRSRELEQVYSQGFDILRWLREPETAPDTDYLVSAPISFPLIGLAQLLHYSVACNVLGQSPAEMRDHFKGVTGHSQGIITAAVIAAAESWNSFNELVQKAITILFWIGCRSQQTYPETELPHDIMQDSIEHDEGKPGPMLIVRGLLKPAVETIIDGVNRKLDPDQKISVALINSQQNFVLAGPPMSLYAMNVHLRGIKATASLQQARVPFSKRKPEIIHRFLPISAPFHSAYLDGALTELENDIRSLVIKPSDFAIPVFHTFTGEDLRMCGEESIVMELAKMITSTPVDWEKATQFSGCTHIVDFGPGGAAGVGALTHKNKEGAGVRVILAGTLNGSNSDLGYKAELFDCHDSSVKFNVDWSQAYGPRLMETASGNPILDTKLSRLLNAPPVMVAGMTPTTVAWDFVAATINAGFHIELAGGGYHNAEAMTQALNKLEEAITVPGRGITINLIYINPRAISWQIPLIRKLRAEGTPIEGITIGAGIPSIEVANEYIQTLGLKHIAFKPSSAEAIQSVINIAQENPNFPIIIQWTGGRGGGHHSAEDFHQPILSMYGRIRKCENIILVAGSGFGGADDTYPYITGSWSTRFSVAPMPFDGCLLGSRVMTAKEAHTSRAAKQAIVDAEGVFEDQWEGTYGPNGAGGIISVRSEMGEPIHKIATRGVKLWAHLDATIFSVPKAERLPRLLKQRKDIIKRLNADFQKVWFGRKPGRKAAELKEMTYVEVLERMIELMHVKSDANSRWIDKTWQKLTYDFTRRIEERFVYGSNRLSVVKSASDLEQPFEVVDAIKFAYPAAKVTPLSTHDVHHFIQLCRRVGQKPVPFVPVLDDDFEVWFKKDSLWQSEDLEAVVDQDVQRTCILQGPMAVKHSKIVDEPIKNILSTIHESHVRQLVCDRYLGRGERIAAELTTTPPSPELPVIDGLEISQTDVMTSYRIANEEGQSVPTPEEWVKVLAGASGTWRYDFFTAQTLVRGQKMQESFVSRLFAPRPGMMTEIHHPGAPAKTSVTIYEHSSANRWKKILQLQQTAPQEITLSMFEARNCDGEVATLPFIFSHHLEVSAAPIREVLDGRNDRIKDFYYQLWYGKKEKTPFDASVLDTFYGGETTITEKDISNFVYAIQNSNEKYLGRAGAERFAPMDFGIVVAWRAVIKTLFPRAIDGDLLKLVHLSNGFRMVPGAEMLKVGDKVTSSARIEAVTIQESGKTIAVRGWIQRDGKNIMELTSQFFYRGTYRDFENAFERKDEKDIRLDISNATDEAVLKSKKWLSLHDPSRSLTGKSLTFRLHTFSRFKSRNVYSHIKVTGEVLMTISKAETISMGSVDFETAGYCHGNPVMAYLRRAGRPWEQTTTLEHPIALGEKGQLSFKTPVSNEMYARVSGDYNPIHVSNPFASYVDLPGTITHGMYTSARIRNLVEKYAAEGDPARVISYAVDFVGMVLPEDEVVVTLDHVGMTSSGARRIQIEAINSETKVKLLTGTAEVEQPPSSYIFTGQGSQEKGMGMELYASSKVARDLWDRADKHLMDTFGFSILKIVRENPRELKVYFGGPRGKAIRENYMAMTYEKMEADGQLRVHKIFKDIDETTTSYTYRSPTGLLSATQFTQPALTMMEIAILEDMRDKGLIQETSFFAGHSLGEYAALMAMGQIMSIENLLAVVFYRGLTMQVAVERDALGRSSYGMVAVNPSRVSTAFDEKMLRQVVDEITKQTGDLLEIVNFNVINMQYVCTGHLRALDCLATVTNALKAKQSDLAILKKFGHTQIGSLIQSIVEVSAARTAEKQEPIVLTRGHATIPLPGIDVPFHSSFLRPGAKPFRSFLLKNITQTNVKAQKLVGKYVPNLTAKPFEVTREYFEEVGQLTGSQVIREALEQWENFEAPSIAPLVSATA